MRLKSYFSTTVEAAMALARQELGPEAMLLNSRRTGTETRHLGEYEVVFALLADDNRQREPKVEAPLDALSQPGSQEVVERLAVEISELKRHIERLSGQFTRVRMMRAGQRMGLVESRLLSTLLGGEVHENLAEEIVSRAIENGSPDRVFPDVVSQFVRFDPVLGRPGKTRRVVALVGPPGSGKTSTLVKLAARYGVSARRPAQILSTDTFRIGAADQLRSYAAILGLGVQVIETPHALSVALEEHRHKELILIDTPGLSTSEMAEAHGLASVLSANPEVDIHLTAPASMRSGDLASTVDRYQVFRPHKIIFTKMDETRNTGTVLNEAVRSGIPISFTTNGQQIPEDLEPASIGIFAGLFDSASKPESLAAAAGEARGSN